MQFVRTWEMCILTGRIAEMSVRKFYEMLPNWYERCLPSSTPTSNAWIFELPVSLPQVDIVRHYIFDHLRDGGLLYF